MPFSMDDRDCFTCVNESICKSYMGEFPATICRDYEPRDDDVYSEDAAQLVGEFLEIAESLSSQCRCVVVPEYSNDDTEEGGHERPLL